MNSLDDCSRMDHIRATIKSKPSLTELYSEYYLRYAACKARSPSNGISLEIGSGAGFLKDVISDTVTSDIISYRIVDLVFDAAEMPFHDCSISSVFLLNTLHHIPRSEMFFNELTRCLMPGGRVLIIDQYHGVLSRFIFKHLHHEPYDPRVDTWNFKSSGPLSDANGAICWVIFYRDKALFEKQFPALKIVKRTPHTPFRYWLSGGLKRWNLLPSYLYKTITEVELWLEIKVPALCSFVDIELMKSSCSNNPTNHTKDIL